MSKFTSYRHHQSFRLESGFVFDELNVAYHTYGTMNSAKDNVVWVCHALTANSDVFDWWKGIFGDNDLFNPKEYFIVCANILGSHYGTTGPLNYPSEKEPSLQDFPSFTTRDLARIHDCLRIELGIEKIHLLIGASLGGQQAMEWAIEQPELIEKLVLIATNARHSAYGIAFNETQRQAIFTDPTYGNGTLDGGRNGLKTARAIALLSYRSYDGYLKTQTSLNNHLTDDFPASSYQRYQGQKLADRFNAYSYVLLSKAMDAHNVGRKRASVEIALQFIKAKTLVIGIDSDLLFPVSEQEFLAEWIEDAYFARIDSDFGHDGFLVEHKQLSDLLSDFMYNDLKNYRSTVLKKQAKEN
ncbi:MAG: homoserine O-acetyltransferase [Bacteroidota bacterium]|jgi:homoserine O-acetyltransferase